MTMTAIDSSGRSGARDIAVWDPLVRLIHWSLALCILLNGTVIDDDSDPHRWIGYVAMGLVAIRLVWGLTGPHPARFSAFPPSPARALQHLGDILAGKKVVHLSHNPLGALMVYNIWLCVLALGATGYMMTTNRYFGVEWVSELHELIFNWLLLSIVLHLAGVVFDTRRSGVNLVRAMIRGRKSIPEGQEVE